MTDSPVPTTPHRELSEKEKDELVAQAFELERRIKANMVSAHSAWWALAESLYEFHDLRGWRAVGYETVAEFLAQPEIGMAERTFFNAVRMWRDYHVVRQLPKEALAEAAPSKMREALPAVMAGDASPEQVLEDAKSLSYRDVIERYSTKAIAQHGQAADGSTPLDASAEPQRIRCPGCGHWTTQAEIDAEQKRLAAVAGDGSG